MILGGPAALQTSRLAGDRVSPVIHCYIARWHCDCRQAVSPLNLEVGAPVQDSLEQEPPIAAAGGVVYRWSSAGQLEILLIKKQDGFWTLPKGRIEPGEDERAAVLREVAEETSITGEIGALVRQVFYTIQKAGRRRRKTVSYYLVRAVSGRPRPQARERILRVRWFAIGVALRRIRRRRLRNVVRAARTMLNAGAATESGEA
jgi:8-oxo-dGTP diphosphatase